MTDMEIFYENIKIFCAFHNIKMSDACQGAGYSESHLRALVYCHGAVTMRHVRDYAKALGAEPTELMGGLFDDRRRNISG